MRWGGDEFVCALSDVTLEVASERVAEVQRVLAARRPVASISAGLAERGSAKLARPPPRPRTLTSFGEAVTTTQNRLTGTREAGMFALVRRTMLLAALCTPCLAATAQAATFTVNSTVDARDATPGDGACETATAGQCTLRATVDEANSQASDDVVNLPAGVYILTAGEPGPTEDANAGGDLDIAANGLLTIDGAGADDTIIDGDQIDRVLDVAASHPGVVISDATLRNGLVTSAKGGGIRTGEGSKLTLTDSAVTLSWASSQDGGGIAGGSGGTLTLTRSTIERNQADDDGGGIHSPGTLVMTDSFVRSNGADDDGGGLYNDGSFAITGSTFALNMSDDDGGGLYSSDDDGQANQITNTTFSDNLSDRNAGGAGEGGAINNDSDTLKIGSSTIADNESLDDASGGIYNDNQDGVVELTNTIVAGNKRKGRENNCGTSVVSNGNNLDTGSDCGLTGSGDQQNANAGLERLRDNGGPTPTRALRPGSDAINTGGSCPDTDQRGGERPPPSGSAGADCDIGAYEANSLADLSVTKVDATDPVDQGDNARYTVTVTNDGPDDVNGVSATDTLPAGMTFVSATPDQGTCSGTQTVTCSLGTVDVGDVVDIQITARADQVGTATNTASVGAAVTDTAPSNNSTSITTTVRQRPSGGSGPGGGTTPAAPAERDRSISLEVSIPESITVAQFLSGFEVTARCTGEPCVRRFREHAAFSTRALRPAGYNAIIGRETLDSGAGDTVKLRPCVRGSRSRGQTRKCLSRLARGVRAKRSFRVKVVVVATDAAGNRTAHRRFVTVR